VFSRKETETEKKIKKEILLSVGTMEKSVEGIWTTAYDVNKYLL
jgi:hypothetical protein